MKVIMKLQKKIHKFLVMMIFDFNKMNQINVLKILFLQNIYFCNCCTLKFLITK